MITDGKILVGGRFNRYGGWPAPCLVRLLPDGTVDASFRPGFSPPLGFVDYGQPEARLHFEDGILYAAGTFASPEEAFPRAFWRLDLRVVPALTAEAIGFTGGGAPRLSLAVIPGVRLVVEASTDLVHWDLIADTTPAASVLFVTDQAGRGSAHRFYRVQFPEP